MAGLFHPQPVSSGAQLFGIANGLFNPSLKATYAFNLAEWKTKSGKIKEGYATWL
jgi:hypothetical protein